MKELSTELSSNLREITNLMCKDHVFLESMKRPLECLLLKWEHVPTKSNCNHLNMRNELKSHSMEVKYFLSKFAHRAELELFISITTRKKYESVGEGNDKKNIYILKHFIKIQYCLEIISFLTASTFNKLFIWHVHWNGRARRKLDATCVSSDSLATLSFSIAINKTITCTVKSLS